MNVFCFWSAMHHFNFNFKIFNLISFFFFKEISFYVCFVFWSVINQFYVILFLYFIYLCLFLIIRNECFLASHKFSAMVFRLRGPPCRIEDWRQFPCWKVVYLCRLGQGQLHVIFVPASQGLSIKGTQGNLWPLKEIPSPCLLAERRAFVHWHVSHTF